MASARHGKHGRGSERGNHNTKLSKLLSYTLRHGAIKEGLHMSSSGFVLISEILVHPRFKGYNVTDIQQVVADNDKQRFLIREDETKRLMIRANQGHSLDVPDLDVVLLSPGELPYAIHGTYEKRIADIKKSGLSKMGRQHIHMAVDLPGEGAVISGMRKSCDYIVTVNVTKAQEDGLVFYRSSNNVILCEGNEDGFILPKYFSSVKPRKHS